MLNKLLGLLGKAATEDRYKDLADSVAGRHPYTMIDGNVYHTDDQAVPFVLTHRAEMKQRAESARNKRGFRP